jgi:DNA topoisomerase I
MRAATPFEWPKRIEFVDSDGPGLTRRRCGRGFLYLDADGARVADTLTLARIAAIAIPPAWEAVWIAASSRAHLQATGRDQRKRKQYRYHPVWSHSRRLANYTRLVEFASVLPHIRAFVDRGLRRPTLDKERVLAVALRLLDSGMIRIGNDEYAKSNGSRGLTTLRKGNVAINGSELTFHFIGKGGAERTLSINDSRAARALRRCHELPGHRLFKYVDPERGVRAITSGDVNAWLQELTARDLTAKDFRTWAGTVTAFEAFLQQPPGKTQAETVRVINDVGRYTAAMLGNTLAVCKRYYIHPRVIQAFESGELSQLPPVRRKLRWLTREETALARLLQRPRRGG